MIADEWFVGGDKHDFRHSPRRKWADHANHATLRVPNFYNSGTGRFNSPPPPPKQSQSNLFDIEYFRHLRCCLKGRDVFVGKNQRSWRSIPRYETTPPAEQVKLDSMQGSNLPQSLCLFFLHFASADIRID